MLTLCLGLCLVASCVHVNYTVTYDMDNCYLGRSAAESPGNFGEFHSVSRAVAMYVVKLGIIQREE